MMKHITGAMIKSVNTSQMSTPPSEVRRFFGPLAGGGAVGVSSSVPRAIGQFHKISAPRTSRGAEIDE
jgi:hypothetical protein